MDSVVRMVLRGSAVVDVWPPFVVAGGLVRKYEGAEKPPSISSSPQPPAVASPQHQHHPQPVTIPTNHPLHHAMHRPQPPLKGALVLLSPVKGALVHDIHKERGVMDAPTLPVYAEKNLGDPIKIRVDIVHPAPVDVFPAATVLRPLAQYEEAIRGIHGHLQGVPINEEMNALRFRMGMAEEDNASLRGRIKTMEAIDTITRRQEKRARMELERQLASFQESQRQDQENFRKLQEFVTSQLGHHS
nr:hypothetical protein [Tanacetum cinerariifolium]